ncbi:unnamed protein product, partial [Didymodactylos carnosus]
DQSIINDFRQQILSQESESNQVEIDLIDYLHSEMSDFSNVFVKSLKKVFKKENNIVEKLLEHRMSNIKSILKEKRLHQNALKQVSEQISTFDSTFDETKQCINVEQNQVLTKYNQIKQSFHQLKSRERHSIQPILGTQLELRIRTLDDDLELMERLINGKSLQKTVLRLSTIVQTQSDEESIISKIDQINMASKYDVVQLLPERSTFGEFSTLDDKVTELVPELASYLPTIEQRVDTIDIMKVSINERLLKLKQEYNEGKHDKERLNRIKLLTDEIGKQVEKISEIEDKEKFSIQIRDLSEKITDINIHLEEESLETLGTGTIKLKSIDVIKGATALRNLLPITAKLKILSIDSNGQPIESMSSKEKLIDTKDNVVFVVNETNKLISEAIKFNQHTPIPFILSKLQIGTFIIDENTNRPTTLLTEEQIEKESDKLEEKMLVSYVIDNKRPVSEPLKILLEQSLEKKQYFDHILQIFKDIRLQRHKQMEQVNKSDENSSVQLFSSIHETFISEWNVLASVLQNKLDELKIEEKIIEKVTPIIDKRCDMMSSHEEQYIREKSLLDNLLKHLEIINRIDEGITHGKSKYMASSQIQYLESNLIQYLIDISKQLNNDKLVEQIEKIQKHFAVPSSIDYEQALTELKTNVFLAIKHVVNDIKKKCELLLMEIYSSKEEISELLQVRTQYIQFLDQRHQEEKSEEIILETLMGNIERLQFQFYQII